MTEKNDLELTVIVGCGGLLFHSMGSMMCAENGRGLYNTTMFVDGDAYEERNGLRQPWGKRAVVGKSKAWIAAGRWERLNGSANARDVMVESRTQLVELFGEMTENFTEKGRRNLARIVVLALPDNDKARSVCARGAMIVSEKWPSKEVWFVTAGNNLDGGQAIGYRLRGGRWEDARITTAHDELWNPQEEQGGIAHCDADVQQNRESNVLTAVCIGNVLEDLGTLQAGTEWYWHKTETGLSGAAASIWREHIWVDPDQDDDEQKEEVKHG